MAGFAGQNLPVRTIVMAGGAFIAHLSHAGVELMFEQDRLIKIGDIIKNHRLWCFRDLMTIGISGEWHAGTGSQT
jgi:hypothetical protein